MKIFCFIFCKNKRSDSRFRYSDYIILINSQSRSVYLIFLPSKELYPPIKLFRCMIMMGFPITFSKQFLWTLDFKSDSPGLVLPLIFWLQQYHLENCYWCYVTGRSLPSSIEKSKYFLIKNDKTLLFLIFVIIELYFYSLIV